MSACEIYTRPPGLVGDIADYILSAAPRPVPHIALAGAIGLMAGVCGRAFNVSGTGLNLYVLLIAETGTGKEGIASGISSLIAAIPNGRIASFDFLGPAEVASAPALIKHLAQTSNSFVSVVGEIGILLQLLTNPRAAAHLVGLKRAFLDLYNKSGRTDQLRPLVYSDREKNTPPIQSPAFSMIGETTPGRLYEALDDSLIADGLLPRFTIIVYRGDRPSLNKHRVGLPSPQLTEAFANLCSFAASLNRQNSPVDVGFTPEAERSFDLFDAECDAHINTASSEASRHLWNRAHIKSLKLAALVAVGINPFIPSITPDIAEWAIRIERENASALLTKFDQGDMGVVAGSEPKQQNEIIRCIGEYIVEKDAAKLRAYGVSTEMHSDYVFTQTYLSRRLIKLPAFNDRIGPTAALKRALSQLIEGDEIREIPSAQMLERYGSKPRAFVVSDATRFLAGRR